MDRKIVCFAVMALAAAAPSYSDGAFIQKDSADFASQYNAIDGFLPESDPGLAFTAGQQLGSPTVSGGVLTYQTGGGSNFYNYNWWDANGWVADPAVGWTVEAEVNIGSILYGNSSFGIFAGSGATLAAGALDILPTSVSWAGVNFPTGDNQDGFHVFRIAQEANSNLTTIWRDGELIGSAAGNYTGYNSAYFGDGAGYSGTANIKYVRYDLTGAFEPVPVPEPTMASLALLGMTCFLGMRRR